MDFEFPVVQVVYSKSLCHCSPQQQQQQVVPARKAVTGKALTWSSLCVHPKASEYGNH